MIKTKFYISPGGYPVFYIDEGYEMLWELGSCKKDYVDIIVSELEKVKNKDLEGYYFGRERYGIDCNNKSCTITDDYENTVLKTVSFEDIYVLMKSWKEYYENWEKKNPDKV